MPPASIGLRGLAFFWTSSSSQPSHRSLSEGRPSTIASRRITELSEWIQAVASWYGDRSTLIDTRFPEPSKNLTEALTIANELQLLCFWLYFSLGEAFFAGSSLGKRICRIRSVSTVTLGKPPIMTGIVRGGMKTLTLYFFFPIGMIATLVTLFFNKRHQMGHDMMSRTAVIDEKMVNSSKS